MALVGIDLSVLIQMLVMAFVTPIGFILFIWFVWIPKPARTYTYAKLFRQTVAQLANDLGNIRFIRGKVEGSGVFYTKKEEVVFIPRSGEPWVNKRFSADKISTIYGYTGKALGAGPEMLATLEANQNLASTQLLEGKDEVDLSVLPDDIRKSLEANRLNVEVKDGAKGEVITTQRVAAAKKGLKRLVVLLFDPRILRFFVSKMISPAQIQYMQKKAYEKGYKEGQRPMFARLIPIMIVMVMIVLVFVTLFGGGIGGGGG